MCYDLLHSIICSNNQIICDYCHIMPSVTLDIIFYTHIHDYCAFVFCNILWNEDDIQKTYFSFIMKISCLVFVFEVEIFEDI